MSQLVIETHTGWMIRCRNCGWHEFPKKGKPKATWIFNGDMVKPTFTPSMNEGVNLPDCGDYKPEYPSRRCHFNIRDGNIIYCGDCSHDLKDQTFPLEPYSDVEVKYYKILLEEAKYKKSEI